MALHSSWTWVCVSSTSPHSLQRKSCIYFWSCSLHLAYGFWALNIILALYLGSSLIHRALFPGSEVVRPYSRCFIFYLVWASLSILVLKRLPNILFILPCICHLPDLVLLPQSWSLYCVFFPWLGSFSCCQLFSLSRSTMIFCFLFMVYGSSNPVSKYRVSLAVLCQVVRTLFRMLSFILLIPWISPFFNFQKSHPCIVIATMLVSISSQMVLISMCFF